MVAGSRPAAEFLLFLVYKAGGTDPKKFKESTPAPPPPLQPLKPPEFTPVQEDVTPLKTTRVDLSARNTPLRDVLYSVAAATSLNLVMDKDVNPEVPVTLTLTNVTAEDALNTIFTSVDYFYTIKNNLLIVKSTETKTFELGFPAVIQNYSTELGGDIVGAGEVSAGSGGSSSGGGSSGGGGGGSSNLKGSVSHKVDSDKSAYNFWEVIENSLKTILGAAPDQQYVINKLTGTIVVTASKKNLERVEQYLELTKKVIGRQVLVEAKIIEVTLSDNFKFGLDWDAVIRQSGVGTINLATKGISSVVAATNPMFNIATTANDFFSVLNTIQQLGEVRVLSNPRVSMMNGQASLLCVGRKQSFISKTETSNAALGTWDQQSFTVETSSVLSGIIIGIVPYVSENGEISLTITPITSDLVKLTRQRFGGVGRDSRNRPPHRGHPGTEHHGQGPQRSDGHPRRADQQKGTAQRRSSPRPGGYPPVGESAEASGQCL